MKKIGTWALAIGLLGLLATFNMDTSVESGSSRVHNIGLMNMQQNLLFVFIAVAIGGVVILVSNNQKTASIDPRAIDKNQARRACPFCAEHILSRAIVCRYCGRDVAPIETTPTEDADFSTRSQEPPAFEILLYRYLADTEDFIRHTYSSLKNTSTLMVVANFLQRIVMYINKHINKIAMIFFALGAAFVIDWALFLPSSDSIYGLLSRLEISASMILVGLIINFRATLVKQGTNTIIDDTVAMQNENKDNKSSLPFFGLYIDLVLLQFMVIYLIFSLHNKYYLNIASALSLLSLLIGYCLTRLDKKIYGFSTIFISILYITYRYLFSDLIYRDAFIYWNEQFSAMILGSYYWHFVSYSWIKWIFILSFIFPHVQLLQLGVMKFGNLRGDITLTVLRHKILLPFCSAIVFYILLSGVFATIMWSLGAIDRIFSLFG